MVYHRCIKYSYHNTSRDTCQAREPPALSKGVLLSDGSFARGHDQEMRGSSAANSLHDDSEASTGAPSDAASRQQSRRDTAGSTCVVHSARASRSHVQSGAMSCTASGGDRLHAAPSSHDVPELDLQALGSSARSQRSSHLQQQFQFRSQVPFDDPSL